MTSIRRTCKLLVASASVAVVVAGCSSSGSSSSGDSGTGSGGSAAAGVTSASLKMQVNVPAGAALQSWVQKWIDQVKQQSGKKIKITTFQEGQLYSPADSLPATTKGALDIDFVDIGSAQGYLPAFTAHDLPLIGLTDDQMEAYTGPGTPLFTALSSVAASKSLELMPTGDWIPGSQSILLKKPISSLSGINGRKIRSLGGLFDTVLQNLSASPVDLAATDVPTSLQTNAVNGAFGSASVMNTTWKGLGKQDLVMGSFAPGQYVTVFNTKTWGKLSKADQDLLQSTLKAVYTQFVPVAPSLETDQEKIFTSTSGQTVYHLSPADETLLRNASGPVWSSFAKSQPTVFAAVQATAKSLNLTIPSE
jgi:TRAP-type C4-dicarboxylate transport system substrate-binding protein